MKDALNELLKARDIWQASAINRSSRHGTPSGFANFDHLLPDHGWPTNGVTELLHDHTGIGELRLLMPALAHLSQQNCRWLAWVAPPCIPYAPALLAAGIELHKVLMIKTKSTQDSLWAMEKALASGSCSSVLGWTSPDLKPQHVRRLQIAAREGNCWGVLFRPTRASQQTSPAELRILLHPDQPGALSDHSRIKVRVLKRRGGWASESISIDLGDDLNRITPVFNELTVPDLGRKDSTTSHPAGGGDAYFTSAPLRESV